MSLSWNHSFFSLCFRLPWRWGGVAEGRWAAGAAGGVCAGGLWGGRQLYSHLRERLSTTVVCIPAKPLMYSGRHCALLLLLSSRKTNVWIHNGIKNHINTHTRQIKIHWCNQCLYNCESNVKTVIKKSNWCYCHLLLLMFVINVYFRLLLDFGLISLTVNSF